MNTLYTTSQLAAKLGCDRTTVYRAAIRLGIGSRAGRQIVLTEAEARQIGGEIAVGRAGNPNFVTGNYFGGTKKRPKTPKKQG